jgi:DNA-binding NtrC family response regulator
MNVQQIKQRFGIIGGSPLLERAIDIAMQVAATDLSVLVTGESGTGKEVMPQIIHQLSARKHNKYIAVNCGAIPEGTIDSELFGHEKGSFTGAHDKRKGYFEEANGGTLFLDEVAELPLQTQVRLLRVLETGEYLKVGSSQNQKTNVRVIAATNVDIPEAIKKGKFREDLFYRLNTVPIHIPPLRNRKEDVHLLFRKFAVDFAEKYHMPAIRLSPEAIELLTSYRWKGNIRQLKNVTEQISVIETEKQIDRAILERYLPPISSQLPILYEGDGAGGMSEREILYKVLFDLKRDVTDLKKIVFRGFRSTEEHAREEEEIANQFKRISYKSEEDNGSYEVNIHQDDFNDHDDKLEDSHVVMEESLSIADTEKQLIRKALSKYNGKRKLAAHELGISERTLYRKIKEYNL